MRATIILCAVITACPKITEGHTFTGRVERVIDGDTIIVGTNRVRLAEIDAPELKTAHGPAAKKALSDTVLHRIVRVEWKRRGRYRRMIGQVYCGRLWINRELIVGGWARPYTRRKATQGRLRRAHSSSSLEDAPSS